MTIYTISLWSPLSAVSIHVISLNRNISGINFPPSCSYRVLKSTSVLSTRDDK